MVYCKCTKAPIFSIEANDLSNIDLCPFVVCGTQYGLRMKS
jgi:hypothetical protein